MIEIKNLYKNYGNVRAVKGINFKIKDGEIVGFLGSNGAGKSTTLKILSGYLSPSNGQVLINNLDITENSHEIKKIIGYLPESNPLYNDMMVYDLLEFTAKIRGIPDNQFILNVVNFDFLGLGSGSSLGSGLSLGSGSERSVK